MINNHLCCISYQKDNNKTRAIHRYNIQYTKCIKFRYFNSKELDVRSLKEMKNNGPIILKVQKLL